MVFNLDIAETWNIWTQFFFLQKYFVGELQMKGVKSTFFDKRFVDFLTF